MIHPIFVQAGEKPGTAPVIAGTFDKETTERIGRNKAEKSDMHLKCIVQISSG